MYFYLLVTRGSKLVCLIYIFCQPLSHFEGFCFRPISLPFGLPKQGEALDVGAFP